MPEIRGSYPLNNDRIRNCGFSGSEERLTTADMQRLAIPNLSSPSYIERQDATKKLMAGGEVVRVLVDALSNPDPNIRRRVIEILDAIEFKKERGTFLRVGDQESLNVLSEEKRMLKDFRKVAMKEYPKGRMPSNIVRATCKSKIYESLDIDALAQKISAFKTLKSEKSLHDEVVKRAIKVTLLNIVDEISGSPELMANRVEILKTLGKIDWSDFNRSARLSLLRAIEEVGFKGPRYSHPRFSELLGAGMDARALLGLDSINPLISSDRKFFIDNVKLDGYLDGYKQSYQDYLSLLSDSKNAAQLNEQGELLFYYKQFLGAAASCKGPLFNSTDSPIFFKFIEDFNLALEEKDLVKIRKLYNENIDIIRITEFEKEEECCDWDVLKYRTYLPQIVDKVLRVEDKRSQISPSLTSLFQICVLDNGPSTGMEDLDQEIKNFFKKTDDLLLEGAKDSKKDFSELLQKLARLREGTWNLNSLVANIQEGKMPEKLKEAYLGFLETEEISLEWNLIKLYQSEPSELDTKLEKFYRSDYIGPITTQQVYEALVIIENNTHFEYSGIVVGQAKLYKGNLISKLRNADPDLFSCIDEAKDFVFKADKKLMR